MEPKLTIDSNGTKFWWLDGELHRNNGPAVEYRDGTKVWYLNGKQLYEKQLLSEQLKIDYPDLYNNYLVFQIMGS